MSLRLLLRGALGQQLGRAPDEAAFLNLEPARLEDGLPKVEGDLEDTFDGGNVFLREDPGWVMCWGGGPWERGRIYHLRTSVSISDT